MNNMNFRKGIFSVLLISIVHFYIQVAAVPHSNEKQTETNLTDQKGTIHENDEMDVIMNKFNKKVQNLMSVMLRSTHINFIMSMVKRLPLSTSCIKTLNQWRRDFEQRKAWAYELVDASGSRPVAALKGAYWFGGDYDQCLDVVVPNDDRQPGSNQNDILRGQYCVLRINISELIMPALLANERKNRVGISLNGTKILEEKQLLEAADRLIRIDVCIPTACSINDLQLLLDNVPGDIYVDHCEHKENVKMNTLQIICCACFAIIFGWVAIGTTLDVIIRLIIHKDRINAWKSNKTVQVALSASFYTNTLKFMETKGKEEFDFTHGIRFLCMLWVILTHVYGLPLGIISLLSNLTIVKTFREQILFCIITNGFVDVDTFFFLSGCFQIMLKLKDPNLKINYWKSILIRYIRFTFFLLIMLGITFLLPLAGTGPFWKETVQLMSDKCESQWWQVITYVKNFFMDEDIPCLGHAWFLCCWMQLYLFSLLLIFLFKRWPKVGLIITGLTIAAGLLNSILYFIRKDAVLFSDLLKYSRYAREFGTDNYFLPSGHLAQYGIGILTGYVLAKHPKLTFTKIQVTICWIVSIFLINISLFGGFLVRGIIYLEIAFSCLFQTLWTIGLAGIVIMCAKGHGGVVNRILSWKVFVVLSRVSLLVYLLHVITLASYGGTLRRPIYIGHSTVMVFFLALTMVTLFVSYICYVCIQLPFDFVIAAIFSGKMNQIKTAEEPKEIEKDNHVMPTSINFTRM